MSGWIEPGTVYCVGCEALVPGDELAEHDCSPAPADVEDAS